MRFPTFRIPMLIMWAALMGGVFVKSTLAQDTPDPELSGGLTLHMGMTQRGGGAGVDVLFGKAPRIWQASLDLYYLKDAREGPTTSFFGTDQGKNYVFGKLNHLFVVSPTFGMQVPLFGGQKNNFMDFRGGITVGPALGLTSPYYLEIFDPTPGNPQLGNRVLEAFDPANHPYTRIVGRATLFDGKWKFKVQPGISVRAFTWIDFNRDPSPISGIRLGVHGDWFFSPPPLWAEEVVNITNRKGYLSISAAFIFGNRW